MFSPKILALAGGVVPAPLFGILVPLTGLALGFTATLPRAVIAAIDVTAVAATTDQRLAVTALANEQPS